LQARLDDVAPLLADTRSALRKAEDRNLRADDLVQAATSITTRADAASQLAYRVATSPVVRLAAWGRGVRRGVGALKSPRSDRQLPRRPEDLPVPVSAQRSAQRSSRRPQIGSTKRRR
jgi:hypothetical protein